MVPSRLVVRYRLLYSNMQTVLKYMIGSFRHRKYVFCEHRGKVLALTVCNSGVRIHGEVWVRPV